MSSITIEIKNCLECPYVHSEKLYTGDSWEHAYDYFCSKTSPTSKKIAGYIEWPSEMPDIPDWCPCRPKNEV